MELLHRGSLAPRGNLSRNALRSVAGSRPTRPDDGRAERKTAAGERLRRSTASWSSVSTTARSATTQTSGASASSTPSSTPGTSTSTATRWSIGEVSITNGENWITQEGADTEDDESLRDRGLRSWSELARVAIKDTYLNVCEAIPGVLYVSVNDQHPRGQGTIDVIVTSEAGTATESLLEKVRAACETIKAPDDNVLVKSAETVTQPIALTVTVPNGTSRDGLDESIQTAITDFLQISKSRVLNELTHADLIYTVKSGVPAVRNVIVTAPAADMFLESDKVILPGSITVTIEEA